MKKTIISLLASSFTFFISTQKVWAIQAVYSDAEVRAAEPYISNGTRVSNTVLLSYFSILVPALWIITAVFMIFWLIMKKESTARKVFRGFFIFFFVISVIVLMFDLFVLR